MYNCYKHKDVQMVCNNHASLFNIIDLGNLMILKVLFSEVCHTVNLRVETVIVKFNT